MKADLKFIAADFLDPSYLPKEKLYLYNYFPPGRKKRRASKLQRTFVRYVCVFGVGWNWRLFQEHTGYRCTHRFILLLLNRLRRLEAAHSAAKASMDFETLADIEQGRFKIVNRRT